MPQFPGVRKSNPLDGQSYRLVQDHAASRGERHEGRTVISLGDNKIRYYSRYCCCRLLAVKSTDCYMLTYLPRLNLHPRRFHIIFFLFSFTKSLHYLSSPPRPRRHSLVPNFLTNRRYLLCCLPTKLNLTNYLVELRD